MKNEMKTHWVADTNPLCDEDVAAIELSIKTDGQQRPIVTLPDGRIIDGRCRMRACKNLGIDPIVEVFDPVAHLKSTGVEDPTEKEIERAIVDMANALDDNNRDKSASSRALKAARIWKRLYPDGAPNPTRMKAAERNRNFAVSFQNFAARYRVGQRYAEMALLLANKYPDLLDKAEKEGLPKAYDDALERQKKEKIDDERMRFIKKWNDAPVGYNGKPLAVDADLLDQIHNGKITVDQAYAAARQRKELKDNDEQQYVVELEGIKARLVGVLVIPDLPVKEIADTMTRTFKDDKERSEFRSQLRKALISLEAISNEAPTGKKQ